MAQRWLLCKNTQLHNFRNKLHNSDNRTLGRPKTLPVLVRSGTIKEMGLIKTYQLISGQFM